MENTRRKTKKYVLLAILLVAVFVLPSCRTRISNNSEITNVKYDEDGFMSESYQERRDELGLSTAERPIMPNLGSNETDDDDDFSEGESIDYNPEEFQEDFPEPETNTNNNNNNNSNSNNNGTRTPTRQTTPPTRRSTSGTTTTKYTVTFKGNGGKPESQTKTFTRNSKISFPTNPTRSGYTFDGWYTKSKNGEGTKVDTKVIVNGNRTLYAHWTKKQDPKPTPEKTFKITLKGEDGTITDNVKEGGKYTLPKGSKKKGYKFVGWAVSPDGGDYYEAGDQITMTSDITLYAYYEKDPEPYWQDQFDKATKSEKTFYVAHGDDDTKVIQDSGGKSTSADNASFIIGFAGKDEDAEQIATDLKSEYEDKTVIVIPKSTNKSSGAMKVLYQVFMLNAIQEEEVLILEDAENDLGISAGELEIAIQ